MIETRRQKSVAGGVDSGTHKALQRPIAAAVSARGYNSRLK
jgi:hypothetical protein